MRSAESLRNERVLGGVAAFFAAGRVVVGALIERIGLVARSRSIWSVWTRYWVDFGILRIRRLGVGNGGRRMYSE